MILRLQTVLAATLLLVCSTNAIAMPETTVKVLDHSNFVPKEKENWFLGTHINTDVGLKGMKGFGFIAGYNLEKSFFLDLTASFYQFPYNAVKVDIQGLDQTNFQEGTELLRDRSKTNSTMLTVGPGIGLIYKLFGSKHWVEMARFGLNYLNYGEGPTRFIGGVANFQASVGYRLDPALISLGFGWNLGYMQRTTDAAEIEHNNFLPLQWWSCQLSALLWVY